MLTLKFLAGLGTVFLFAAFFCFKAVLGKKNHPGHEFHSKEKNKNWLPLVLGIISMAAGILIFINLIRRL